MPLAIPSQTLVIRADIMRLADTSQQPVMERLGMPSLLHRWAMRELKSRAQDQEL